MPTDDFSTRNVGALRRTYFRNLVILFDPTLASDTSLLYGRAAEDKYYELGVDGNGDSQYFANIPAGTTNMKFLNPFRDYYASTAEFAAFTTDRPTGAAGAYFIQHSRIRADACIQTITRNTGGLSVEYWRIYYWTNNTSGGWHQRTITAVAFSAT